jgi:ubiquinone biosynthesis UbiH/UbiF/VisC/COQ6 family hydroxylase
MTNVNNKTQTVDITIVGGNIIGAATALSLAKIGFSVALIEKTPPSVEPFGATGPYALRVSAIIPVVRNFLQQIGVWQELLEQRIQPVHTMQVWEKDLEHSLHFNQQHPEQHLAWIIENNHIQNICWQLLAKSSCKIITGEWQKIKKLPDQQGMEITLNTPDSPSAIQIQSKLLIGADGAKSTIRQWSGILSTQKSYHQHCIVGNVRTEKPHQHTAWQRYHNGLAFAFLPLADGSCSIAWYVDENQSTKILEQTSEQHKQTIYQASGAMLGKISEINEINAFPIIRSDANTLYNENLLLIGDAVRTIHPMAGQGVNLGLCDASVLTEIMGYAYDHKLAINEPLILRKYARKRSEYKLLQTGMDTINFLFQNSAITDIRPSILKHLNKLSFGKNILADIAMGYHTHLPNKIKQINIPTQ